MRLPLCVGLMALACATCQTERAFAQQGSYSSKTVYGMFGPRVLGQTLQSPVRRPDRGIARDGNGDFLGINLTYSGRMFAEPKAKGPATPPTTVSLATAQPAPPLAPQTPEVQPGPDEWLRSQGEEGEIAPPLSPGAASLLDSTWLRGSSDPARPRGNVTVVGFSPKPSAPDPFAQRIAAILQGTPQIKKLSPIRVVMNGETAVLRGRVAATQDRELAENLVRLEPGVWDVRNELTVGPTR